MKKKGKLAKKTGKVARQYKILLMSNVPEAEIPAFADPEHWLRYFPPFGKDDLRKFGCPVDWRRSFITTDYNPYYDYSYGYMGYDYTYDYLYYTPYYYYLP